MRTKLIASLLTAMLATTAYAGPRELVLTADAKYGPWPWVETSIIGGVGPFVLEDGNLPVPEQTATGHFYMPQEADMLRVTDLGNASSFSTHYLSEAFDTSPATFTIDLGGGSIPTPEPSSLVLAAIGALALRRRRR